MKSALAAGGPTGSTGAPGSGGADAIPSDLIAPDWIAPDWIAVDWGTTHLRAWAMREGRVAAEAASDAGMATVSSGGPAGFEAALLAMIGDWLGHGRMEVLAAGMVGARQGWSEAPYLAAPCRPHDPAGFIRARSADPRLVLRIAPGLMQADPPDVMRGEETQIAGFLVGAPDFDGVVCLPGTHSKWVRVSAGEIVGFRSFMTGELFALLAERSVLRHSVGAGWDDAAFAEAVAEGVARPEAMAAALFRLRAGDLIGAPGFGLGPGAARARLSGLLIGVELAAAKGWWLGHDLVVIGAPDLSARYGAALEAQGVLPLLQSGEVAALAGLIAAKAALAAGPGDVPR